jgi:hypothetical protein
MEKIDHSKILSYIVSTMFLYYYTYYRPGAFPPGPPNVPLLGKNKN